MILGRRSPPAKEIIYRVSAFEGRIDPMCQLNRAENNCIKGCGEPGCWVRKPCEDGYSGDGFADGDKISEVTVMAANCRPRAAEALRAESGSQLFGPIGGRARGVRCP